MKKLILKTLMMLCMMLPATMQAQILACQASFTATVDSTGHIVQFTNTSSGAFTNSQWIFGDGTSSTATNPTHTYNTNGPVVCCLTIWDINGSCQSMVCDTVLLGNSSVNCFASFNYQSTGNTYNFYGFTSNPGANVYYSWTFGDGDSSAQQNPTHTYSQTGTYNVCLTIATGSGCTNTVCYVINITSGGNLCNANYVYQTSGNAVSFYSNSAGYSHNWSFGDGTFSFQANPVHTYGVPGVYQVCHTVYDSMQTCSATYCDSIIINAGGNCISAFTFTVDSTGYLYSFVNTSTGALGNFTWSFGDGTGSTSLNPSHLYLTAGVHIVCLTYTDPATGNILCSNCVTIVAGNGANPCMPVFYSFPDSNAIGNGNVHFGILNTCLNTQFVWNFGDSTMGSGPNPSHMYNDSGWYYVCVTAYTPSGNYTYCDSVFSFRFTTTLSEAAAAYGLTIYPNPMAGNGHAKFTLPKEGRVTARITDMQGRIRSILIDETLAAGLHTLPLNTNDLQNGIYLLALTINNAIIHERITVVK